MSKRVQQHGRIDAAAAGDDDRRGGNPDESCFDFAHQRVDHSCRSALASDAGAGLRSRLPRVRACWRPQASRLRFPVVDEKGITMVIKRIGVARLAIFQGCMGVAIGLIASLLFMLFSSMFASRIGGSAVAAVGGFAMMIVLPIFYGIGGFIVGAIAGGLYNLVAGFVGGIEIEVD
jgi:hypothetical protein